MGMASAEDWLAPHITLQQTEVPYSTAVPGTW
jgi:hypothetical protein